MHNRPIAKLIKWFVKREKGKLVDARIRNTTTFCLLDMNDQKKILLLFLFPGKLKRTKTTKI